VRAAAGIAVALAFAACGESTAQTCPGEPVATFQFAPSATPGGPGWRVYAGDPALAGLDPVPDVPDCSPAVGYPDQLPAFQGTLSNDASAAALCRPVGIVLYGQHAGDHYDVEGITDGAVLASCGSACAATLRLVVAGDLAVAPDGSPTAFQGILVEVMIQDPASDCGTCLPEPWQACAGRYTILGTP
jgi:hypothetical protein